MHMKATPHNVQLMADFNIKTLLLTRNVYDSIVSFSRDLMKKKSANVKISGLDGYSFIWLKNCSSNWMLNDYIEYSIKYYLPWYLTFLSSWADYKDPLKVQAMRYEFLRSNPYLAFSDIVKIFDSEKSLIQNFLGNRIKSTRISGTNSDTGSGYELLSPQQRSIIESYFEYHDDEWILSHLKIDV